MIFFQQIINKNIQNEKNLFKEILDEDYSKDNLNIFFEYKNDTKKLKIIPYNKKNNEFIEINFNNQNINNLYNLNYLYTLTYDQRIAFLYFYFLNNINNTKIFVLKGPSFSGKTYLINYFAKFYNKKLVKIYLNNDHGLSVILGQISPNLYLKPEKQEKLKDFITNFKNKIPEIFENVLNEIDDEKKWTSNFIKQIYDNINNYLLSSEKNDKYNTKLNEFKFFLEEINEFTNNIDFEKESAFIKALKNGDWILLDGIENTQAELFEKISSLNNFFPILNLFEKNNESYYFKNNNLKNFNINNNFRIFITYNPEGISDIKNKLTPSFLSQCSLFSLRKIDDNIIDSSIYLYSNLYKNVLLQNEQQIVKCLEFSYINKQMEIYSNSKKNFFAGNKSFSCSSLYFIILIRELYENVKNSKFYDITINILQITYSYSYLKEDFNELIKRIKNSELNKDLENNNNNYSETIQNNKELLFNLINSEIKNYYNNFENNLKNNIDNINIFDLFDYIYYYQYKQIPELFNRINSILNKIKENNNIFGYIFILKNILEELKNDKNIKPFNNYLKNYQIKDNLPPKKEFNDLINIINKFKIFYQIVSKYKITNIPPFIYKTQENNEKIFFEISSFEEIKNWNLDSKFNIFEKTIIIIELFPQIKNLINFNNTENTYEINKNLFFSSELFTLFFDMIINLLNKQSEVEINISELNRTFEKLTNKYSEFYKIINSNEDEYFKKCKNDSFYSIKNEINIIKKYLINIKIIEKNINKIIDYYQKIYDILIDKFNIRTYENEIKKLIEEAEELSEKYKKIFINYVESLKLDKNSINFAKAKLKELKEQKELDELEENDKKIVVKELEKIILFNKDLIVDNKKEKISYYYQIFMYIIEFNFFKEITKKFSIQKYAELTKHMNLYEKNKITELLNFSEISNDQNINKYWIDSIQKYYKEFLNNFNDNFYDEKNKNKIKNFINKIKILLLYVFCQSENKLDLIDLKNFIEKENKINNINLNFAFKIFKNYINFNIEFPKFIPNEIADYFDNHFDILKSLPNYKSKFSVIFNSNYQDYKNYIIDIINMFLEFNGIDKINNNANNLNEIIYDLINNYNKEDNIKQFLQNVFKLIEFLKNNKNELFNKKLTFEIEDYKFFENDLKIDFNSNRLLFFYSKNIRKLFFLLTNTNTEKYFKKNINKLIEEKNKNKNYQLFLFLFNIFSSNQFFIPDYKEENNELNKKLYLNINSMFDKKINNNNILVLSNLLSLLSNEDAMNNNINEYIKCFYFYIKNLYLYQKIKKIDYYKEEFQTTFLDVILEDIINISVLQKDKFLLSLNEQIYKNSLFEITKSFEVEIDKKIEYKNVLLKEINEIIKKSFQDIKKKFENNKNNKNKTLNFQDKKKIIQENFSNYEKLCNKILNSNEFESEAFKIFKEINEIISTKLLNELFDKDNFIIIKENNKNNKNIIEISYKNKNFEIGKSNKLYNINIPNKIFLISDKKKNLFFQEFEKQENNILNNFVDQIKNLIKIIDDYNNNKSKDILLAIDLNKKLNLDVNNLKNYKEFSDIFDFIIFYEKIKSKLIDLNRLFEHQKNFNEIGENLKKFEINNEIKKEFNKENIEKLFKNKNFNEIFKDLNVISYDEDKKLILFSKEKFIEHIKIIKNESNNKKEFKFYSLYKKKLNFKIDNFKVKSNNFNLKNKKNQFNLLFDIEHYKNMFLIKNEDPLNFNFILQFNPKFEEQINYEEYEFNFDIFYEQNNKFIKLIECNINVNIVPLIISIESNYLLNENKISKFNINDKIYFKLNLYDEDVYDINNIHFNNKIIKKDENQIENYKIESKNNNKLINISFNNKDLKKNEFSKFLNLELNFSVFSSNFNIDLNSLIIQKNNNEKIKFVSYDNFNNTIDDIFYNIYCYDNNNIIIDFGVYIKDNDPHNLKINLPKTHKINFKIYENIENMIFNEYLSFSIEIIISEIDFDLLNKNYEIEAVIDNNEFRI